MTEIRVGVVGLGYWGPVLARNFASHPRTRLAALVDSDPGRLQAAGGAFKDVPLFTELEESLSLVDAVAIATPVSSHYALARTALENGKHLFIEKPMARTSREAKELQRLAEEKGLVIAVDHLLLYQGVVRKVREIIESGELGEILYYDSVRANLGLFQQDVDVVWDLGPHEFSQMIYLLGEPEDGVLPVGAAHYPAGLADDVHVHFRYPGDVVASVYMSWLSPFKRRMTVIGGSRKMLAFSDLWAEEEIKVYERSVRARKEGEGYAYEYERGGATIPAVSRMQPLKREVDEFAAAVLDGAPLASDGRMGVRITELLEECESALYGRREDG